VVVLKNGVSTAIDVRCRALTLWTHYHVVGPIKRSHFSCS